MRSSAIPLLASGLLTDTGLQRSINQDAGVMLELPRGGLYAVADGMGGHVAGELAANLALDTLSQTFLNSRGAVPERLAEAVQAANLAVLRHAVGEYLGMGTTMIALVVDRGAALLAHVGDSRAYLLRDGQLHRLTEDHSWVAEQVRLGHLTEAEARTHQWRSVVSNALGGEERVRLELYGFALRRGDRVLLCSDGLSGVIEERELYELLARGLTPEETTRQLIDAANAAGGPDNITAIVLDTMRSSRLPHYPLPVHGHDGPMYADVLLDLRRGNSPLTYLALVLLYFVLMGLLLYPERRVITVTVGLGLLLAIILGVWGYRRMQRPGRLPDLPCYSPAGQATGDPASWPRPAQTTRSTGER
ncbi:PP2C family serine/threonine-protein phosphatase [Deinococcus sonorensis]|uniref:PP2C family serine/threonine-protein phosphatase n=2 Tax=Deinococcus sonorensis TaxID=309891 RepID=A0AAU7UD43_9DEIO